MRNPTLRDIGSFKKSGNATPARTCIAFPAGTGDGRHCLNVTDKDAAFLVVGDRTPDDEVTYPDIDLELQAGPME